MPEVLFTGFIVVFQRLMEQILTIIWRVIFTVFCQQQSELYMESSIFLFFPKVWISFSRGSVFQGRSNSSNI